MFWEEGGNGGGVFHLR